MAIEFRLLGEVSARDGGRPLDTGHARQQCVLAVLLVEANRVVPADQLLERAWGDRPPQRARGTLQSYLSRLRKAMGVSIALRTDGYVLAADPMAIDVHRFQALVGQARAADDERALALFDKALGLWCGEAFGPLQTPWLAAYRETLDRRRLAALLDRNDVALRRGEHAVLLCDLVTAHAAHPWDERLAAQLMLALYRSGRQADAFDVFHAMRRRLADETGTDPGPQLLQVYHQILNADRTAVAPARAHERWTPRQLPAGPGVFTGRVAELAELGRVLHAGPGNAVPGSGVPGSGVPVPIAVIGGVGGIGKTSLALRWAHANLDRFPDGQLYANLRGFDPSAEPLPWPVAIRGFLDALGVAPAQVPAEPDDQAALYRSLVAGRRLLVVLDNARDAATVVPLLPGTANSAVLVTSRRQLASLITTHGARPLTLDVLSGRESRELLTRYVGAARLAVEDGAVAVISRHCAGLPLALGIVAARAALRPGLPLAAVADELQAANALDVLEGGELAVSLRAVLACSVRALSPAAARVFALFGLAPGPDLTAPAAVSLTGLPADELRASLRELTGAHLVQEHRSGRYRLHDLVRLYAVELAGADPSAVRRLLDHYLHTAHRAALLLSPQRDPLVLDDALPGVVPEDIADLDAAIGWFAAEHRTLLAAIRRAGDAGFDRHAHRLPWTLATFFDRQGHWLDWVSVQQTAVTAARRLGDPAAQAEAHRLLAGALSNLRLYDEAQLNLQQAVDLFGELGDDAGRAHTTLDLAMLFDRRGDPRKALPFAHRSLALYRRVGSLLEQAVALNAIGWYHAQVGDHRCAIEHCRQALALSREAGSLYGQANTLDSLGYAHHHLGEHDRAVSCYDEALVLFLKMGDRHAEAIVLTHLGDTYEATARSAAARDARQRALDIFVDLGHADAEALREKLA